MSSFPKYKIYLVGAGSLVKLKGYGLGDQDYSTLDDAIEGLKNYIEKRKSYCKKWNERYIPVQYVVQEYDGPYSAVIIHTINKEEN